MSKALTVQLTIAGGFRDIWLYKDRILVWDRNGSLYYVEMKVATRYLAKKYGQATAILAQCLLFRNDWKVGEQLRALMQVPAIEAAYLMPFAESESIKLDLPAALLIESDVEPYIGPVLDTEIYANRVYLCTPDGLLESYISPKDPTLHYGLELQLSKRVSKLSVRYAAMNASAEDDGLFFAKVGFVGPDDEPGFMFADWTQVAETSMTNSHAARNLLNYADSRAPTLLRARVEEAHTHPAAKYDEYQVVGYEDDHISLQGPTFHALTTQQGIRPGEPSVERDEFGDFQILGNSNYRLLTHWNDRLHVIDLKAFQGEEVEARPSKTYQGAAVRGTSPDEILETYPLSSGFVVELDDSLRLITRDGSHDLHAGAAARVRTFASSLRYKEVTAIIGEAEAAIIGYYLAGEMLF